jgi:hypothetical protein
MGAAEIRARVERYGLENFIRDAVRLALLIEKYTGIPRKRTADFLKTNAPSAIFTSANAICRTDAQREKLVALAEFRTLYETMQTAEKNREGVRLYSADTAKGYFTAYFAESRRTSYPTLSNSKNHHVDIDMERKEFNHGKKK